MATRKPRGGKPDPDALDALAAFDAELSELDSAEIAPPTLRAVPRGTAREDVTPELVDETPTAPKKRASGGASRARKPKKSTLGETVGGLLGTLAGGAVVMASGRLAGPIVGPHGAMTPDEAQSITRPLGNIIGRHAAPKIILPGVPTADQADVDEIAVTLLQWMARVIMLAVQRWGESQQARAMAAAGVTTPQATNAPRRDNPRPLDTPPPFAPPQPLQPDAPPAASDRPTDAPPAGAVNAMSYTDALLAAGVGYGDRGESLIGS